MTATLAVLVFFLAILVLMLCGCRAQKQVAETRSTTVTTERASGVSPRDTALTLPGGRVEASLPLPPQGMDLPPTTARSERAWSTVSITHGVLTHAGGCDTVAMALRLWDRWERTALGRTEVQVRTERTEVPVTPKWAWWALGAALLMTLWRLWPLLLRLFKPI